MSWAGAFEELGKTVASRAELRAMGATGRMLTAAVRYNHLVRVRRDHYALPTTERSVQEAVRVGGRLGCLSALAHAGIFVGDARFTHAHVEPGSSRCRNPNNRFLPLNATERDGVELHWTPLVRPEEATEYSVGIVDALAQAVRCQHPWLAIASIDNALFTGAIRDQDIADLFASLPTQYQELRALVDGRAEAGQESVLRMIVRQAGLDCELQVHIAGVGRVDIVVEKCLVLEADSRLAHDGWELHVRDRNRDLDLARRGYASLRPVYQRIMYTPAQVREAIVTLLATNRNYRGPGS